MKNSSQKKRTRDKVISGVVSLALLGVIGVGSVSIYNSQKAKDNNKNYVDLNEIDENVKSNSSKNNNLASNNTNDNSNNQTVNNTNDNNNNQTANNTKKYSADLTGNADTEDNNSIASNNNSDTLNNTTNQVDTTNQNGEELVAVDNNSGVSVNTSVNYSFKEEKSMMWPVMGNIILDYSMDKTVYFQTLKVYKCSPAILISAQAGTQVLSSTSGIVENIETTDETGITMTINIGDGYLLKYGQLDEVSVGVGDVVNKGQAIATISEPTKYYKLEGSSLYFQMLKDNEPTDPVVYFE